MTSSSGEMLRTEDGGRTWRQLTTDLPLAEPFRFATTKDGWVVRYDQLFVTHDAGNTWSKVSLKPPLETKLTGNSVQAYNLPIFENQAAGFLTANYGDYSNPANVLFSSRDLGRTWKFKRMMPRLVGVTTIFDNTWITVSKPEHAETLSVTRISLTGRVPRTIEVTAGIHGLSLPTYTLGEDDEYDVVSMVDDAHGWLLVLNELLATPDGGASWADITPGGPAPPAGPPVPGVKIFPTVGATGATGGTAPFSPPPSTGGNVVTRLGFETSSVPPVSTMAAWWTSSPYFAIGVYLRARRTDKRTRI